MMAKVDNWAPAWILDITENPNGKYQIEVLFDGPNPTIKNYFMDNYELALGFSEYLINKVREKGMGSL